MKNKNKNVDFINNNIQKKLFFCEVLWIFSPNAASLISIFWFFSQSYKM